MAKRTTTKKRAVKEADFEVTVQDNSPGSKVPSKTSKVQANSPEHAIDAANDGKPTSDAEVVTVKKAVPGVGNPNAQVNKSQGVHGQTESVLSMKAIAERVDYPYSISLPIQFRKFLSEVSVSYTEVGHTALIEFANKNQLSEALRAFKGATDAKATLILEGISRSLK